MGRDGKFKIGGIKLNSKEQKIKLPKLICMTDVEEKDAEWLVSNYLAKGCVNLLAGSGGSGKTTTWCGIVAAVSAGKNVFFDTISEEFISEPQKVLFFSSEDSVEHTLRARLRKAGANLNNVFSVNLKDESFVDIKFNSPILEKLIDEVKPALIVFDPIQSFIPSEVQMAQRNAMRNCLNSLIGWGEKYGCTFIIVVHTNKKQNVFGRNRVADSSDIWDIARSVLIIGETQDGKRYLSQEKSNYGELQPTAIFDISDGVAVFESYSDKKDKDFVMEQNYNAGQASQKADAEHFIYEFLRHGKKPTKELDEAAKTAGISKCTLSRAKTELKKRRLLDSSSEGFGNSKVFYSYLIEQKC